MESKNQSGAEITGITKFLGELGKILTRVLFWSKRHSSQQMQNLSVSLMEKKLLKS